MANLELNIAILANGDFNIEWVEADNLDSKQGLLEKKLSDIFVKDIEDFFLYLAFAEHDIPLSSGLSYLRRISSACMKKIVQTENIESVRDKLRIVPDIGLVKLFLDSAPFLPGSELITEEWILSLWKRIESSFISKIKKHKGSVADFIRRYSRDITLTGRVFFHLVENKNGNSPFAFLATYSTDPVHGKSRHLPLKNALEEFGSDKKKMLNLLSTMHNASTESPFIKEIMDSGEMFHPLALSAGEAYTVLKEIPIYEKHGILSRIPDWWKSKAVSPVLSISMGEKNPSVLGTDAILDFNPHFSLNGEILTENEIRGLLKSGEGLALIKGRWIEADKEKIQAVLEAYGRAKEAAKSGVSFIDAMKMQLRTGRYSGNDDAVEISPGNWLKSFMEKTANPAIIKNADPGRNFNAALRPYQEHGLGWLDFLDQMSFGACLADDMGLGKTVQLIALINSRRSAKKPADLLVVPASLIANWINELDRFAPSIKYYAAHPSENKNNPAMDFSDNVISGFDLIITSYSMLKRYKQLSAYAWDHLIIDEAQAIKNPVSGQTRAVKAIRARQKIALTGTPIENRLSDLWSIFDFINPGLLGSAKEFGNFIKRLKNDDEGYTRLKKILKPFILRRLKTDRSIINDLPDKVEMKIYSYLTKKQTALYMNLVSEIEEKLRSAEGIQRKGLILSSIIKFKQICNHSDQYLGQERYNYSDSGKYEALREICGTIYEKRERVLVFTQFREITEHLKEYLETIFPCRGLALDGSTPVKKRREIIAEFQGHNYVPFMVLSIKAGGVGLNLTEANHVIHFDRWWNPAVENQATDRAFRIGQKKNVIVHKFITRGTIEEKIDKIIENKVKLSQDIISDSGGEWITEMDNESLMDLFRFSM